MGACPGEPDGMDRTRPKRVTTGGMKEAQKFLLNEQREPGVASHA